MYIDEQICPWLALCFYLLSVKTILALTLQQTASTRRVCWWIKASSNCGSEELSKVHKINTTIPCVCLCMCVFPTASAPGSVMHTIFTNQMCATYTASLSSSHRTACYFVLWPLGSRLIYMLRRRETWRKQITLASRETASLLWSVSFCWCVCSQSLTSALALVRTSCPYWCQMKI